MLAELADRQMGDRLECAGVVAVEDQARDVIVLVGDERLGKYGLQRDIGERQLGGNVLLGGCGGDAGQPVAGARRRCLRKQRLQRSELACPGSNPLSAPFTSTSSNAFFTISMTSCFWSLK